MTATLLAITLGLLLGFQPARSEIIDRIAVTVGNRVITESMVLQQIRLAAFVDGREPKFDAATKRQAADTLVSQFLLVEEMDNTRYPEPAMTDAVAYLKQTILPRFADEGAYQQALEKYRITDEELRQFLQRILRSVNFIDLRFGRGQQVSTTDINDYYQKSFAGFWKKSNGDKPLPPLEEVTDVIEEQLLAERTDRASEDWLRQTQQAAKIRYREEVFQ
jgi:hypothetical protein